MSISGYLKGWLKYIFNNRVSKLSLVYDNCIVAPKATIYLQSRLRNVKIGNYSYVGRGTIIHDTTIGKFCSISDFCVIGLPNHSTNSISTSPIFSFIKNGTKTSWVKAEMTETPIDVRIGNDVWIGYRVIIPSNVIIGDGAVIAAGAVVVKDVPPYAIVGGVPARVLKYRFTQDVIDKLLELRFWDRSEEEIKDNIRLFQKEGLSVDDLEKWTEIN